MKLYKLPSSITKTDVVVLANGSFPTHDIPLSILQNNEDNIICCDGAIDNLCQANLRPLAIVGDCDSLSNENKIKFADQIHQVHEQDTNDLTKTIHFCKDRSIDRIIILGATGRREDHTIANISLLADYIDLIEDVTMVTDYGVFNAINTTSYFESFEGQQVSLFNIGNTPITSKELKYSIENQIFKEWWQATLNESLSNQFEIETSDKTIIFRAF